MNNLIFLREKKFKYRTPFPSVLDRTLNQFNTNVIVSIAHIMDVLDSGWHG